MIVDSSALVAILLDEPDAKRYMKVLMTTQNVRVSAVTAVETAIVTIRRAGINAEPDVASLFDVLNIEVVPFGSDQVMLAQEAYRTYGKGRRHPAKLNFGDCFSYALAKVTGEPLLFKGSDFTHTDIASALA
jgi:ribonuclease VapC